MNLNSKRRINHLGRSVNLYKKQWKQELSHLSNMHIQNK